MGINYIYIEIKGTQRKIEESVVRSILESGTRRGLATCGWFSRKAKEFMIERNVCFLERVPLEEVINYDILQERI